MKQFKPFVPYILALMLLALPALAGVGLAAPAAAEVPVQAVDSAFEPKVVTITAGDTIVWTNTGNLPHTVTASDRSWDSGRLEPGATFSRTFDTPGTIQYYCKPHGTPDGQGMAGTIVVQAAGAGVAQQVEAPEPVAEAAPQPFGFAPSVDVRDQPVVGGSVTVPGVVAAQDGWMVIHTNTAENRPGPVLGQTMVKAGENSDVRVSLSQAPRAGDMLWAMLHIDAGQMGSYEFPGPDTPVNSGGQIVMEQFTITAAAPAPTQLPNSGEAGDSGWMMYAGGVLLLLLGGLALKRGLAGSRQ